LAALSYSAKRYDSAIFSSNMSCDAFLSEALYEADKALKRLAWNVLSSAAEACVFTRWRTEQTMNRKCMFYSVILR